MASATSVITRLRVEGMDCAACAIKIENALRRIPGVTEVNVSVAGAAVTVRHDLADTRTMSTQIAALGYAVTGSEEIGDKQAGDEVSALEEDTGRFHVHNHGPTNKSWWQTSKADLTIASGTALAVAFVLGKAIPATEQWAFLLAMMVGLVPIGKRAISAAIAGTPFSIEMLMTIA
ncbi:MAG: cation transporter, partial [Afipia sp.]|nr:cation transporter [Afipia sp.]